MRLTATDIQGYFRPEKCSLRVFLRAQGIEEAPTGPYEKVLVRLGREHEKRHLATFPNAVDLSGGDLTERASRTQVEVRAEAPVIYQGVLTTVIDIGGKECEVLGRPDFLIQVDNDYTIRDSKMSRRITEKDHPEILLQLDLYGWMYERTLGRPPLALEVHSGTGDIVALEYQGGQQALDVIKELFELQHLVSEPHSPVGWSKCGRCGYRDRCWKAAIDRRDVALVQDLDQNLAAALHQEGIQNYDQLLEQLHEEKLAEFKRPWGKGMRKVGKAAARILLNAQALATRQEILLQPPAIPDSPNYVMFDLEGLPPQLDELEKIYLWGMHVFGEKPGEFLAATAGFGEGGDLQGWEEFIKKAASIFQDYGDIPFVHWHHYEKTHLNMYIDRYGDRGGVAERVRTNLLDLLPITKASIALPLPSNSLKVVEQHIGFERTQEEYGGDWAMAKFIEATEMADETSRMEVMEEILRYNKEDLEATWAVFRWLSSKGQ